MKAARTIIFAYFHAHSNPLFYKQKIMKLIHLISTEDCTFINNCFSCNLHQIFTHMYTLALDKYSYHTRHACNGFLTSPICKGTMVQRSSKIRENFVRDPQLNMI